MLSIDLQPTLFFYYSIAAVIVLLLLVYYFLHQRDADNPVILFKDFGRTVKIDEEERKLLMRQKILHRNVAFFAYLLSIIVSFVLGSIAVTRVINHGLDKNLIAIAFEISGGLVATVSFRRLYKSCKDDIEQLK